MKKAIRWTSAILFAIVAGGGLLASAAPTTVAADGCDGGFLGFPTWYRGLTDDKCEIKNPGNLSGGLQQFITIIALNVVQILLLVAVYVAVAVIIVGGFWFMTSLGEPQAFASARKTIWGAVVGLAISLAAVAIVQFVYSGLIGGA